MCIDVSTVGKKYLLEECVTDVGKSLSSYYFNYHFGKKKKRRE